MSDHFLLWLVPFSDLDSQWTSLLFHLHMTLLVSCTTPSSPLIPDPEFIILLLHPIYFIPDFLVYIIQALVCRYFRIKVAVFTIPCYSSLSLLMLPPPFSCFWKLQYSQTPEIFGLCWTFDFSHGLMFPKFSHACHTLQFCHLALEAWDPENRAIPWVQPGMHHPLIFLFVLLQYIHYVLDLSGIWNITITRAGVGEEQRFGGKVLTNAVEGKPYTC